MSAPFPQVLVLGINYPPEPTGISPYTGAMARGLSNRGHGMRVLTAHPHYPQWKIAEGYGQWSRTSVDEGVELTRLRHYVPQRPSGLRRAMSEVSFGVRLATARWRRPAAIVSVSPALISTAIARMRALVTDRRTPFIVWVQDLYSLGLSETGQGGGAVVKAMQVIERWVLRRATRVIVIHERFAERVHLDFGVPRERIEVIRNWTHLPASQPIDRTDVRARWGWAPDETIVLHAGNMGVKQGLDNVVAAAKLAQAEDRPVRFVFLGGGSDRARLKELAAGVDTTVFMDSLPDDEFAAALQAADILLVNEKHGVSEMAVPSKLTSYFSAGRPVLAATDASGITAEEITRADAGVSVAAGDPRALLDGVLAMRVDPNLERYGASGQHFRATVLDEGAAIDAFEGLLARLIDASDVTAESAKG